MSVRAPVGVRASTNFRIMVGVFIVSNVQNYLVGWFSRKSIIMQPKIRVPSVFIALQIGGYSPYTIPIGRSPTHNHNTTVLIVRRQVGDQYYPHLFVDGSPSQRSHSNELLTCSRIRSWSRTNRFGLCRSVHQSGCVPLQTFASWLDHNPTVLIIRRQVGDQHS